MPELLKECINTTFRNTTTGEIVRSTAKAEF